MQIGGHILISDTGGTSQTYRKSLAQATSKSTKQVENRFALHQNRRRRMMLERADPRRVNYSRLRFDKLTVAPRMRVIVNSLGEMGPVVPNRWYGTEEA